MEFDTKKSLRKSMIGFLNQRERCYKMLYAQTGNTDYALKVAMIQHIKTQFQFILRWDYWRHCREVILQENRLITILPSSKGKHNKIRTHMFELIEYCRNVQNEPCHVYRFKHSGGKAEV